MISGIVCDLDGTLCNDAHRKSHAEKKAWDEYHARCHLDKPNEVVRMLLWGCMDVGVAIIFLTGRPERYRKKTVSWLQDHIGLRHDQYTLLMRPDRNYVSNATLKQQLLAEFREQNKFQLLAILEDSPTVCAAWHELGLPVMQCVNLVAL